MYVLLLLLFSIPVLIYWCFTRFLPYEHQHQLYVVLRRWWEYLTCSAILEKRVLFCGLENAGKSTLIGLLENDKLHIYPPSRLQEVEVLMGKIRFEITELGFISRSKCERDRNWC